MQRIRRDDTVLVIRGRERGKRGQVHQVEPDKDRVYVTGVNMVKRHQRQQDERTPAGIIEKEAPIHASNVKLICTSCDQPVRVTFRVRSDGVKVRVCKSCSEDVD
jgi:large subunit ribosomal protein L24